MWQNMPCGPGGWYSGGWGMFCHGAFMLLVFAGLALGLFFLIRLASGGGRGPRKSRPTVLEILDERYARGEIDREEYLQRKQDIAP